MGPSGMGARACFMPLNLLLLLITRALLRTCSKSLKQQDRPCQVNELQTGIEQPLAVLAQSAALAPLGKAALNHSVFETSP